jgi:uncharacterized membrane protein YphA (DoxX/SURF4 family)
MKRTTIVEIIVFLYAILFLYTGISKLMDYSVFKEQLSESPILAPMASLVASTLPWIEFLVVTMMVIPRWRLKGFYAALTMMTFFTIYVVILLTFNDKLPCSCGGIISAFSWMQHIFFNTGFIALAVWALILQKRIKKENRANWNPIPHTDKAISVKSL